MQVFAVGIIGADFTDPGRARQILIAAAILALLGALATIATVWWWRQTRADHPALGPLEAMGQRHWRLASETDQAAALAAARPVGAEPISRPSAKPESVEVIEVDDLDEFDGLDESGELDEPVGVDESGDVKEIDEADAE